MQSKKNKILASWGKYRPKQLVQSKIWGMEAEDAGAVGYFSDLATFYLEVIS
jgi:hypothetical protein